MPIAIRKIKAYSEEVGLDKVAALTGEYDSTGHLVTIYEPYELLNGGPREGEPFTLGYDEGNPAENAKGHEV